MRTWGDPLPSRVLVVGLARAGRAATAALRSQGIEVVAYDADAALDPDGLDATVHLGAWDDGLLDGVGLLVKSPGVPAEAEPVPTALARGVPVVSEIELGVRLLPNPFVAVTGTNGKTTTTALLGAILDAGGVPVEVAGNIGRALTSLVGHASPDAWVVCELSSFQLEDVSTLRPRVAVLTNLEPDHLDRHGTFEAYASAKLRAFERQGPEDLAVVPRGFGDLPGTARRVEFAGDDALPAEPRIPGAHNRENAAAATAAARAAGVGDGAIAAALRTFPGVQHRLELVRELRGVRWVNDSKATNTAAARRGVAAYDAPLRLILGGSLKGEDFGPFAAELPPTVRSIYLVGEASDELAAALDAAGRAYQRAGDLERAIARAAEEAEPGDVVLLSPAAASFDQFDNFEQRGATFRRLVEALA